MKSPTGRQILFANGVLSGKSATESARQAGYGPAYSAKAATKILIQKPVAALIEQGQAELREKTMFDLERAITEADSLIVFSLTNKNAMAAAKLLELKCKLHGLLIERVQVSDFVDIGAALLEARQRSTGVIQVNSSSVSVPPRSHIAHDKNPNDLFD